MSGLFIFTKSRNLETELEQQKKYLGHVESLRAIAALMVLLFHFISFEDSGDPLVANETIRTCSEFGAQGVELFYLISGFVIYYSLTNSNIRLTDYPKYVAKRVIRIFPAFWGTIFLIGITPFIWNRPFPYSFTQLLQNATLTVDVFNTFSWMNPIFQTLKVEFVFYILIGFLVLPMKKAGWQYAVILVSALVLTYFYHTIDFVHNVPFFLIGIACCEIFRSRQVILNYGLISGCLLFLYLVFPMEDVVISLIGVILLLWLPIKIRITERIGQFSYSIYLTHGFSGGIFLSYCKHHLADFNPWICIVMATALALGFAYVYYRIIEKRTIDWSKRIRY